jgi:hypothetical protein
MKSFVYSDRAGTCTQVSARPIGAPAKNVSLGKVI